ncbi:hypothetical protein BN6_30370 [Saccharothrix espanaensis DSM 44229]|uniref:Alpha/beta hydrolase fold-3 domain-containing protein n=1 Tax=Saccharothrix espanaensis (strain ATCC 51144 / DSM 44229 / JCM 9112 / NBRC 15066 / NRRL 15764) TaxID=1179773 RepID=K0K0C0_SACES|nr:hypothetical protein BN6_30370 [Saccharothrix espanaensis DSM 44229]
MSASRPEPGRRGRRPAPCPSGRAAGPRCCGAGAAGRRHGAGSRWRSRRPASPSRPGRRPAGRSRPRPRTRPAGAVQAQPGRSPRAARPDSADLAVEDRLVPGTPDVSVRIYRPRDAQDALVWLHGGGFVMGDLDTEHPWASRLALGSSAAVISVGCRLAPENRLPAAFDDAGAVLTWVAEHAAELGVDPNRIAVGAALHRHPVIRPGQGRCGVAALPGLDARHALRRPGTGRGPVRSAAGLHRHGGVLPEPRRGPGLRATAAGGGCVRRAAPVARHHPRVAGHLVR